MMRCLLLTLITFTFMTTQAQEVDELPDIDTLWDYSAPAKTAERFLAILPKAEEVGDSVYLGQLITQIGRTYSLQGQFDEAHQWLDKLDAWDLDDYPLVHTRYFLERGRTYNSAGKPEEARVAFQKAWYIATKQRLDYYAVDAAHMQAIAADPEYQIGWAESAIKMAELSEDPKTRNWLGSLYNNLGWTFMDLEQYNKALEMFTRGLEWRVANSTNEQGIFIAKWAVARAHRALKQYDKALEIQQALEAEIVSKGLDPDGYVYEELGELYLATGKKNMAASYFDLAYSLLSQDRWLVKNEPERLARLKELSGN